MYDVERFAQAAKCNYKRYIGFRSPLRTSYHVDTVAPQNVEQFSGNTGRMLHILAHNSYGGKIFLGFDRTDFSDSHIVAELFAQYFHRQLGIGIAHGKCRIVSDDACDTKKTLIPDFASRLNIRELIPMTPTMPIPDKVMRHVSLIDEIPLMAFPSACELSSEMRVPGAEGLKVFLMNMGIFCEIPDKWSEDK